MASDEDIIRALDFRHKSMSDRLSSVRPSFEDVAQWVDPARGRHLGQADNADSRKNIFLTDSTARKAYRILKAGLMAGLSSPSRPWFNLKADGFEKPSHEEQVWLDEVKRRAYLIMAGSNVYRALYDAYGDVALFGTYGGILKGSRDSVVHVQSYPVGSFVYAENNEGLIDTLHWRLKMTVRQMVQDFGMENVSDRVKSLYSNNQLNDRIDICAAVEPRMERDPMSPKASDMPVGVYYWERNSKKKLLQKGGLSFNGILGPRWETVVDDPWPISSPARDALGDIKQLQAQQRDKDTAIQFSYKPPLVGPAEGAKFSYLPGAYNASSFSDMQKGGPRPVIDVRPDVQWLLANVQETQGRVMEAMYADLFRMASEYGIQGGKDVTAAFVHEIKEEKLIVLGPVLESLDRGLLSVIVRGVFHYMQEYEILPEPPRSLVGRGIKVEFVSLFAQAQRAIGVASIERTVGFVGTLAQMQPGVMDNLDGDEVMRDFAEQVGFPMKAIRDPAIVEAQREAAAEQAQQQQMMQMAQPMAQAANLISEASERGQVGLGI
ncbi:MAG: portal protein [Angustibacter sp.]